MKKVVSFKVLLIGILSLVIMGCATSSFATSSVLESGNTTTPTAITSTEYENASVIPTDSNTTNTTNTATTTNTTTSTSTSTGTSTNSVYNTIDEDNSKDTIPQTGITDGYVGVLLIVFVAASIFAYKKMKDYKNI